MNLNKKIITDYEVDVRAAISILWKEKIIILIISSVLMIIGFLYGAKLPKLYKTQTHVRLRFSGFSHEFGIRQSKALYNNKISELFYLHLSPDSFEEFIKQIKRNNELKMYINKKKYIIKDYIGNLNVTVNKKNRTAVISLAFKKPLDGGILLDQFIKYSFELALIKLKEDIINKIEEEISIYQDNFLIAKELNLEDPVLTSVLEPSESLMNLMDKQPKDFYYNGTKVLSMWIKKLKQSIDTINNLDVHWDPVISKSTPPMLKTKSPFFYSFLGMLLGFSLSSLMILIRAYILQKKI